MSARRSSWKSRGRTALPRQAARVWRLALAQGCSWQRRWSPWEVMKATQTQATSPKVNSPFQRCPEGKWRSRTSATFRRRKVANRMGMSSTRSTRRTCGDVLSMPPLLVPDAYFEQRPGRRLTAVEVALFQRCQQDGPLLLRARLTHDLPPLDRLLLVGRRLGRAVAQQLLRREGPALPVRVQHRHQRRPLLYQTHPRMPAPVYPPLVALGQAEPALQVEVVQRQPLQTTSREHPHRERRHDHRHLHPHRVAARPQALL